MLKIPHAARRAAPSILAAAIDSEHLPNVFDRFYGGDPSRQRRTGGAGLGLAIVRHLVEAHGGAIRVQSAPGEGAEFTITLPAARS